MAKSQENSGTGKHDHKIPELEKQIGAAPAPDPRPKDRGKFAPQFAPVELAPQVQQATIAEHLGHQALRVS